MPWLGMDRAPIHALSQAPTCRIEHASTCCLVSQSAHLSCLQYWFSGTMGSLFFFFNLSLLLFIILDLAHCSILSSYFGFSNMCPPTQLQSHPDIMSCSICPIERKWDLVPFISSDCMILLPSRWAPEDSSAQNYSLVSTHIFCLVVCVI